LNDGRLNLKSDLVITLLFPSLAMVFGKLLKRSLVNGFTHPVQVILVLLVGSGLTILFAKTVWRPLILKASLVTLSLYILLLSPLGLMIALQGLLSFVPQTSDSATEARADVIVVLDRGSLALWARVSEAINLLQENRAPVILVTGHLSETLYLLHLLKGAGAPESALLGEFCARTTEENGRFSAKILNQLQAQRILLVTDAPHMLRSYLIFKSFGFDVLPHPVPMPTSMSLAQRSATALREYPALVSYWLLGRFRRRVDSIPTDMKNDFAGNARCERH
jgi:uncharacterized SAM-binding protein YcdF (DUF218 family)